MTEYSSLPFTITVFNTKTIRGLVKVHKDSLVLEYQEYKSDYHGNMIYEKPSDIVEINLPLSEIESVSLKEGWFRTILIIRANRLTTLQKIPESKHAKVKLKIAREDRKIAEQFVSNLELKIAECKLDSFNKKEELI